MKLIDRELLGDFFRTFLALEVLLLILFLAQVMISRFDDIMQAEQNGIFWGFILYLCRIPRFVVDSGVVAVAASILWNVTRRTRTNEILAYLAGGISPQRLYVPFLAGASLIFVGTLALNEFLVTPATVAERYVERVNLKGRTEAEFLRSSDIFQRGTDGRLYLISSFEGATSTLNDPTIIDVHPASRRPEWMLHADRAVLVTEGSAAVWEFENASVRTFDERGRLLTFDSYQRVRESELGRAIEPTLVQMLTTLGRAEYMNTRDLRDYIAMLDAQGKDSARFVLALHTRLALPLGIVIIAFLVCVQVVRPRAQGMIVSFGGGLMWIAAYYAVFVTSTQLGESGVGVFHPALAAWLPCLLFSVLGVVMLARVSR